MNTQTSYATIKWRVLNFSESIWPSITLVWTFQSLTWKLFKRRSQWIICLPRESEKVEMLFPLTRLLVLNCHLLLYVRTLLFFFFFFLFLEQSLGLVYFEQSHFLLLNNLLRCFLSVFIFHYFLSSVFNFVCFISSLSFVLTVTY